MIHLLSQPAQTGFNEVAIADIGDFQLVVLTTQTPVTRSCGSTPITFSSRVYQTQGWLAYNHRIIAHFENLKIGILAPASSPFKPIQRLAPSIPVSFMVKGSQPLPEAIAAQATLTCQFPDADFPYHSAFCQVLPRFVRVYALAANDTLSHQVEQMLTEEAQFVTENQQQLKQVPFYQSCFQL